MWTDEDLEIARKSRECLQELLRGSIEVKKNNQNAVLKELHEIKKFSSE